MSLILHPDYQLYERKDKVFCSSLQIAEEFEKRHDNVLRDIEKLDCSNEFNLLNFEESSYRDEYSRKQPMFLLTKDGFMFLVMGYRGKKAAVIKEAYIKRFNEYEDFIKKYILTRDDFAPFTRAVADAHDEPKSYHYSNEVDMINRIVVGMTSKQFKLAHGMPLNTPSIRPYVSPTQAKAIRKLQIEDIPMLYKGVPFQERKTALNTFYNNHVLPKGGLLKIG